jgi:hypothetical protein
VFTHMLQVFLSGCCICFTMAFQVFSGVFASISDTYFKCFICCIYAHRRMMQICLSKFSKVDRTLYILLCDSSSIAACCSCYDVMDVRRAWRGCGRGKRRGKYGELHGWSPPGTGVHQL